MSSFLTPFAGGGTKPVALPVQMIGPNGEVKGSNSAHFAYMGADTPTRNETKLQRQMEIAVAREEMGALEATNEPSEEQQRRMQVLQEKINKCTVYVAMTEKADKKLSESQEAQRKVAELAEDIAQQDKLELLQREETKAESMMKLQENQKIEYAHTPSAHRYSRSNASSCYRTEKKKIEAAEKELDAHLQAEAKKHEAATARAKKLIEFEAQQLEADMKAEEELMEMKLAM